jgi:2-polyprenyl-6-methoxyphenol hydroxylase-like FAD-dependent oxidoreductase
LTFIFEADSTISKDSNLIRQSLIESMEGFPKHAMDMIRSCKLNSLHLTDLKYRSPWDLLLNKFHKGTIVVVGDAMHATGPFIAQGGSASIEDAIVLARCLAQKMHNTKNMIERSIVEEAFDKYVKERRMRIFWLSLNTFLVGKKLDTKSWIVRLVVIAIMFVLFRDRDCHSRYNCGILREEEGDYIILNDNHMLH